MIPLIEQHRDALADLCRRFRVRRLEALGSAATGGYVEGRSDLDFLVSFHPDQPGLRDNLYDRFFGLKEGLEALLARPVDLVMSKALTNPIFIEEAERSKVPLYAA